MKYIIIILHMMFNLGYIYSQTMEIMNPKYTNPGIYGKVIPSSKLSTSGLNIGGTVVVTGPMCESILGECSTDQSGKYRISNLPANSDLLLHYYKDNWFAHTEKIKINTWDKKNIKIDMDTPNQDLINSEMSLFVAIPEGLRAGNALNYANNLITKLNFLRLIGDWKIYESIRKGEVNKRDIGAIVRFTRTGKLERTFKDKTTTIDWKLGIVDKKLSLFLLNSTGQRIDTIILDFFYDSNMKYTLSWYKKNQYKKNRMRFVKIN